MDHITTSTPGLGKNPKPGDEPVATGTADKAAIKSLCAAIHAHSLAEVCRSMRNRGSEQYSKEIAQLIDLGLQACAAISSESAALQACLIDALAARHVPAEPDPDLAQIDSLQFQSIGLLVDPGQVATALAIAADEGFDVPEVFRGEMIDALARYSSFIDLTRWDDCSTRLHLRWRNLGHVGRRLQRLAPTTEDYAFLRLPRTLWPAFACIKPIRKIAERISGRSVADTIGLRSGARNLGTPSMLVPRLLALAGPTQEDVVVDLGCGDGRVVIEAAKRYRCRAIGVEQNPQLAETARENVRRAQVSNLVSIHHGPAETIDIESATIIFLFLPTRILNHFLQRIQGALKSGRRLVAHEQARISPPVPPTLSVPVISERALTVGHLWMM